MYDVTTRRVVVRRMEEDLSNAGVSPQEQAPVIPPPTIDGETR